MKINASTPRVAVPSELVTSRSESVSGAQSASTGSAQVALSAASRRMLALQDGSNDIDVERVAAIRDAIASGQFKIDTSRIADGLIATARDLLK
ncbi:flagellar biosynthesis anti-sigma factor FlgM [Schauerella aestuarii]|uniref:flagellar biosynthesis anti-sigma factor FlgM n=1 Tax=Schauerella aestuarii TaxID=2511204 RepID=UPI001371F6E9|nr:flagellar biosynthesis anti-sigma factor FlgM [Achromobacter aestuarii]MYZ44900.1 flagellar biosynthesis anti-sigma factor FlgM [Achromobacter aestuarii]